MAAPVGPELAHFVAIFSKVAASDGLDAGVAAVVEAVRIGHQPLRHTVLVDEALESMVTAIEKHRGLVPGTLRGRSRVRAAASARQELYAAMRRMGFSFPEIGRFCGGRDHATVVAGIQALREREERVAAGYRASAARAA